MSAETPVMLPAEFAAYHAPALASNKARHCVMLAILSRLRDEPPQRAVRHWTLGSPGACAVMWGPNSMFLGELDQASDGRHLFWVVDRQPLSMAALVRRLRDTGAISCVYTPPELRGRGYAGSVTAATVERIFAEGCGPPASTPI